MLGAAVCLLRVGTRDVGLLMALRMHAAASCIHLVLVHGGRLVCESLIISQSRSTSTRRSLVPEQIAAALAQRRSLVPVQVAAALA